MHRERREIDNFRDVLNRWMLKDLGYVGQWWTWDGGREERMLILVYENVFTYTLLLRDGLIHTHRLWLNICWNIIRTILTFYSRLSVQLTGQGGKIELLSSKQRGCLMTRMSKRFARHGMILMMVLCFISWAQWGASYKFGARKIWQAGKADWGDNGEGFEERSTKRNLAGELRGVW